MLEDVCDAIDFEQEAFRRRFHTILCDRVLGLPGYVGDN